MLLTGAHTNLEFSAIAEHQLTTLLSLSDTLTITGSLETHGDKHGD
jgi:hypothetical protein